MNYNEIAESKNKEHFIQSYMTSLLVQIRQQNISTVSIFSWDDQNLALQIALSLSKVGTDQLAVPCCALSINGLKSIQANIDNAILKTIAETESSQSLKSQIKEFKHCFYVAPTIQNFNDYNDLQKSIALESQLKILVLPLRGISRASTYKVEAFSKDYSIHWYGILQAHLQPVHLSNQQSEEILT